MNVLEEFDNYKISKDGDLLLACKAHIGNAIDIAVMKLAFKSAEWVAGRTICQRFDKVCLVIIFN